MALGGLFLMLACFYLAPSYGEVARSFYVLVMLPALIASPIWFKQSKLGLWPWLFFLIPIAYLAASTLWVDEQYIKPDRSTWYYFKPFLFLILLMLAVERVFQHFPQIDRCLVKFITVVALISGIISLWQYLPNAIETGTWPRMAGMSANHDINVTASFFGINIMFCIYGLVRWPSQWRWPLCLSLIISLIIVILSQSKVPLVCFMLSMVWLLLQGFQQRTLKKLIPLFLLLILVALFGFYYFERIPFMDRTISYGARIDLWHQAISQSKDAWYFGHGVGSDIELKFQNTFMHSHNLIFDTLRYGGIFGTLLLVVQMIYVAVRGLVLFRDDKYFLPIVAWFYLGVFFLLTNGQHPLVKPHHIWFYYWLPLVLILSKNVKRINSSD